MTGIPDSDTVALSLVPSVAPNAVQGVLLYLLSGASAYAAKLLQLDQPETLSHTEVQSLLSQVMDPVAFDDRRIRLLVEQIQYLRQTLQHRYELACLAGQQSPQRPDGAANARLSHAQTEYLGLAPIDLGVPDLGEPQRAMLLRHLHQAARMTIMITALARTVPDALIRQFHTLFVCALAITPMAPELVELAARAERLCRQLRPLTMLQAGVLTESKRQRIRNP